MTTRELPSDMSSTLKPSFFQPKRGQSSSIDWLYNLPIKGKQLIGLFTSETISIVGLVGVSAVLIVAAGRAQLVRQAESELAVAQINYNIKIDQMGFGFRGQSDNTAVMAAAVAHTQGQSLTPDLQRQVKQILQNEIKARDIEYATLVGKDRQIIVNANADRTGETFDPNNLVSEVFKNPSQQIKTSQIVSWAELTKESPPALKNLTKQDALIRYTVTPVKDSKTGAVVGALVSGDIVNGKLPIVKNTVAAFDGGYSAIYMRKPTGEFALASALDKDDTKNLEQAQSGVPLLNLSLLSEAVATPGKRITGRGVVGTQSYTVSVKALTDFNGKPIAVLVRGTQETGLNKFLGESLLVQMVISALTLVADVLLAIMLGRTIAEPIKQLQQTTKNFARGDRKVRAEIVSTDEVGELAKTFNDLADDIVSSEKVLAQQARYQQVEAERSLAFADFTSSLYTSLNSDAILNTLVDGVRSLLQVNRVVVYYFHEDYLSGTVKMESVAPGWLRVKGQVINDPLGTENIDQFRSGQVVVCNNIYEAGYSTCHCEILESLQVKANMVAPLFQDNNLEEFGLIGLLGVHQCSEPRVWQQQEIALFRQAAAQASLALKQAYLIEQLERARKEAELGRQKAIEFAKVEQARQVAELASLEQRQQKEELQQQVLSLLQDIEASAEGDLTVRADVTEGIIGTVGDFFNAIIENLRQIVMQVKQTALQVNTSLQTDEQSVRQLSFAALKQADEITRSLDSVLAMTSSIQAVAENARQAATVAHIASTAAETGGKAIDATVDNIVNLRKKVVETANKVKVLDDSSKRIAKVVALVHEISLKTSLLAINAGLEASRAGEEGEGFRVVSEQISKLAKQAVNATQEIEDVLEVIQLGTTEVSAAMEEGRTQAIDSTHMILDARQHLDKIFEVSHQIDELVQSISTATVSQVETSEKVTELMQEIARTSQYTSESSRQVSSSLRQTVEVAEQLQQSVDRFNIGFVES